MREAIKFLGGSVAVYVVMAACQTLPPVPEDSAPGPTAMAGRQGDPAKNIGGAPNSEETANEGGSPATTGQMGMAGKETGVGGSEPIHDAGVMDAMVDAMTDPVPDASAQEMSGSRLKARYYVGDDGSKQFAGWYDSQRKENCAVMTAADGSMRCMPPLGAFGGSYFSDDGCTTSLFAATKQVTGGCAAAPSPKYGYVTSCGGFTYYSLTAASPSMVYTGTPAACIGTTPPNTLDFYSGAAIDVSSFVEVTDQVEK